MDHSACGVVLLVHGLNNRPDIMQPLAEVLQDRGWHVMLTALAGHLPGESLQNVTAQEWMNDIATAYNQATERFPNLPVCYVGFSLGALLGTALVARGALPAVGKMYLFAPAIQFTTRMFARRLLTPLRFLNLAIPSFSPALLRAHRATPFSAYHAMFAVAADLTDIPADSRLRDVPVRVYVSEHDELVSKKRLLAWLERTQLRRWQFAPVSAHFERAAHPHHLAVWPANYIAGDWSLLCQDIHEYLLKS